MVTRRLTVELNTISNAPVDASTVTVQLTGADEALAEGAEPRRQIVTVAGRAADRRGR